MSKQYNGFFVAVDGPNGVGKSTLIDAIKDSIESLGFKVYTTREPTDTYLGTFVREFAETHSKESLACMVAADRYEHIINEIYPKLRDEYLVITDRYFIYSLILQGMDGVKEEHIVNINYNILKPDLQIALWADEDTLKKRLSERGSLTRFEKNNQSQKEILYMESGIKKLKEMGWVVLTVNNSDDLQKNINTTSSYISKLWRKK